MAVPCRRPAGRPAGAAYPAAQGESGAPTTSTTGAVAFRGPWPACGTCEWWWHLHVCCRVERPRLRIPKMGGLFAFIRICTAVSDALPRAGCPHMRAVRCGMASARARTLLRFKHLEEGSLLLRLRMQSGRLGQPLDSAVHMNALCQRVKAAGGRTSVGHLLRWYTHHAIESTCTRRAHAVGRRRNTWRGTAAAACHRMLSSASLRSASCPPQRSAGHAAHHAEEQEKQGMPNRVNSLATSFATSGPARRL